MIHLAAFYQLVDSSAALTQINGVNDPVLNVSGGNINVPVGLAAMVGEAALVNQAAPVRAQFQSPSLRVIANKDVEPIIAAALFGSIPTSFMHGDSPIPLTANEQLNFYAQEGAAGAVANYGLVWFADGALQSVKGNIYSVRATAAVAQVAGAWVNGPLVFAQVLPVGSYQIVGMRARSVDGVAARLVFNTTPWRPGVPMINTVANFDSDVTRYGGMGVFGQFDSTTPPTVDVLGGVAAAQVFDFDVIRVK